MTWQIAAVLTMLAVAVVLFVSERLRVDVVALLLMASLAVSGLVAPREAISGFSNPAVVTIWAVFILSGGLSRTGVAKLLGHRLLRMAGDSEVRLLLVVMTAAATLSAFMSNVGVTALLLPVVMDLARKTGTSPSRLLIPLAYSSLLGGLLTLIGTPPNILVSGALHDQGYPAFQLFDFSIVGGAVTVAGILYMVLIGRHFLPRQTPGGRVDEGDELPEVYDLEEQLFTLRLPHHSQLADRTLGESRLGSALRLNVLAILRGEKTHLAPQPDVRLEPGDRLLVAGSPRQTADLLGSRQLVAEQIEGLDMTRLVSRHVHLARVTLLDGCELLGSSPRQLGLRLRGLNLLALERPRRVTRRQIPRTTLTVGDTLLVQASAEVLDELRAEATYRVEPALHRDVAVLEGRLLALRLPPGSRLARGTLTQSRLGDALGFNVLGVLRASPSQAGEDEVIVMPSPDFALREKDLLLVEGDREAVSVLRGLQELQVEEKVPRLLEDLESEQIAMAEVILSPHTRLTGKTLQDLDFREKFGLQVVAVRRAGESLRSNLRHLRLQLGDALLVYGPREKVRMLAREQDFLVLTEEAQEVLRRERAPVALGILAAVIATVLLGWLPIYIASVAGATAMVLCGCLSMEEAYQDIDWRAVFLIAGMLPLGQAMQNSGAATWLAASAVATVGDLGPMIVLASVFLLTVGCAQIMPTAAAAVLLAPIAFDTASHLGLSPQALLMAVAMGASTSFMSPVGHPSNILVMGPGGYRFRDYLRVGLPLTLVVMLVVLLVLPAAWTLDAPPVSNGASPGASDAGSTPSREPVSSTDEPEISPVASPPVSPAAVDSPADVQPDADAERPVAPDAGAVDAGASAADDRLRSGT